MSEHLCPNCDSDADPTCSGCGTVIEFLSSDRLATQPAAAERDTALRERIEDLLEERGFYQAARYLRAALDTSPTGGGNEETP